MSGTNEGWVKLFRKFLGSPIWRNHNLTRFWTWCLLKATHEPITVTIGYRKVALEPGQFVFTRPMACTETGLSEKTVRMCVEILRADKTVEIGPDKGRKFSVVTIGKWGSYQGQDSGRGRKRATKGPAEGPTINKEDKKRRRNTGGVTAFNPSESPTWNHWVDACRAAGRNDPAPSPGAIQASNDLAEWFPDLDEQRRIMNAYLSLDDPWIERQGYQLALLTKHRIEAARQRADEMENEPDDLNDPRAIQNALECIAEEHERARQQQLKEATA